MPINAHPEYIAAEGEYLKAQSPEEKIEKLKKMISYAPSHKGGENLRAQLRNRLKRLTEQLEKTRKSGKSSRVGIKKEDMQCVLIGKTNSGKSSILNILTNSNPKIAQNIFSKFTTRKPEIGIMNYQTVQIQIVEVPSIFSEYYDKGIAYNTDTVLIIADSFEEIDEILKELRTMGKIILVFNKSDLLSENEKRKISATLKSKYKKYNFVVISAKDHEGIDELKEKIFLSFDKIRVYTKEPNKEANKNRPMILPPNSTIKDVAEKILKGFSSRVTQTKIWGPSSKFSGQIVGLNHKVKDLDIVEFKTK